MLRPGQPCWRLRVVGPPITALGLLLLSVVGCAVLNKDQVGAIQNFSNATKNYGTFPGRVLVAYSDVRSTNNVLQLETVHYGSTEKAQAAWDLLQQNTAETSKVLNDATQVDDALQVLDRYSAELSALASDDYTKQIEQSATDLAQQIDGGVAAYNKHYGKNVSSPGAAVGAVVRGLGDWYIKIQQTRLLKERVHAADPLVRALTEDVETGLRRFVVEPVPPADVAPLLLNERKQLGGMFRAVGSRQARAPVFVSRVSSADAQIDTASALAVAAIKSARKYREAHATLVRVMEDDNLLNTLRTDVTAVRAEVDATRNFAKRLKDQQAK
jgi:hypothetical protein